jgi:hypothetical protein
VQERAARSRRRREEGRGAPAAYHEANSGDSVSRGAAAERVDDGGGGHQAWAVATRGCGTAFGTQHNQTKIGYAPACMQQFKFEPMEF